MAWYRLNMLVQHSELDAKLDEYRGFIQSALARFGGREMKAQVYAERHGAEARLFFDIEGKQPSWLMMRMMRCESVEPPPRARLELLGEIADGTVVVKSGKPDSRNGTRSA